METTDAKVVLKSIMKADGEQSVMITGVLPMHRLCAKSFDVDQHNQHLEQPISVEVQATLPWMMLSAMEVNPPCLSALTRLGAHMIVVIMKMLVSSAQHEVLVIMNGNILESVMTDFTI
ncbi:UNVERIFIED_CONTAM: hypothetical protein K2H54_040711 [Gekko kuhli]